MPEADKESPTREEIDEEARRARRLQILIHLTLNLIAQGQLPYEEAVDLIAATRRVALQLFPGKGETFDLLYRPKLQRMINEVYRVQ